MRWAYGLIMAGCLACTTPVDDSQDPVLATVHNKTLRLSDATEFIDPGQAPQDSIAQLRSYVEQWAREMLLLHEAERNLPDDIDLATLIEDYRASLIVSNYEKELVESSLDTVITDAELQAYYEKNKEQYQLERSIIRCHFVQIKKPVTNRREFRRWWDSDDPRDFARLVDYCNNNNAELFMLEDSTWYKVEEIEALLPAGTLSPQNMRRDRTLTFTDDQYEYYLRILESVLSTEIAPLSYIREQAERYIMHTRKLQLLESIKEDLYNKGIEGDQIKIFIQ
ncbi:MAG: peptidylprolyl isomerase [Saprospiraceae bacterium]|nr:peptidylprolyl isomerase [Saprospiraceae bacterium]